MVLHWKKIKDTTNEIVFKNTVDRSPARIFTIHKYKINPSETIWVLSYTSGKSTITNLYTSKTKVGILERTKRYMKSNK
jgi:hypothetical protein